MRFVAKSRWLSALVITLFASYLDAQGSQLPSGKIYYTYQNATWSMNGDGTSKVALPTGVSGEPSRMLHGGQRWFLQFRPVSGTYPDGRPRLELFAVRGDGTSVVQLTTHADLQAFPSDPNPARWKFDDSKVSWIAARWVGSTLTDAGIYTADVLFDVAGGVIGVAIEPAAPLITGTLTGDPLRPDINDHDWSPDNVDLVYSVSSTSANMRRLYVANSSVPGGAPHWLPTSRPADHPCWSPLGTKILYHGAEFAGSIYSLNAVGGGEKQLVRAQGQTTFLYAAHWSPNGLYFVYGTMGDLLNDERQDVFRAKADGSGKSNLTSELDTRSLSGSPARAGDWR